MAGYTVEEFEEEDEEEKRHGTERQTLDAREAAYREYQKYVQDAYKHPIGFGGDPTITGFGERGNVGQREGGTGMFDCEESADVPNAATHSESARHRDHSTVEQMMRDHQNKMADVYDKFDCELSEKWRRL
jgi:hypothetical protein